MSKIHMTLTLPGQIVNVDNNKVTLELNTVELPILTDLARKQLTAGLPELEAEVLVERINHFACTESIRSNIRMGSISELISNGRPAEAMAAPVRGWEKV